MVRCILQSKLSICATHSLECRLTDFAMTVLGYIKCNLSICSIKNVFRHAPEDRLSNCGPPDLKDRLSSGTTDVPEVKVGIWSMSALEHSLHSYGTLALEC